MSVRVMEWVWEHAAAVHGNDLLVLLALADWADDAGRCWPSIERLAEKARVSERTAQYSVRRLTMRGYVGVERGGGRRGLNRYTVRMPHPAGAERVQILHPLRGATAGEKGADPRRNGANARQKGATALAPEPLAEPSAEPSGDERETRPPSPSHGFAFSSSAPLRRGADDDGPEPPGDAAEGDRPDTPYPALSPPTVAPPAFPLGVAEYAFAAALGIGRVAAAHETAKFLDHYRARAARFADWPAAWRKWMRHAGSYAAARPASPLRHISREHVPAGRAREETANAPAAPEPTPAERAWRAVLAAREGWVAGSPPPVLDADAAGAVALLGGWEAAAHLSWPVFLVAFNTARDAEPVDRRR